MAYLKTNYLKKVLLIQEIYKTNSNRGIPNSVIWSAYVYPIFMISERTFYNYLGINARSELRQLNVNIEAYLQNQHAFIHNPTLHSKPVQPQIPVWS